MKTFPTEKVRHGISYVNRDYLHQNHTDYVIWNYVFNRCKAVMLPFAEALSYNVYYIIVIRISHCQCEPAEIWVWHRRREKIDVNF